jgi:hypothetical protein
MKKTCICGLALAVLALIQTGCQSRHFVNAGEKNGHQYAVPANSIDGYAKAHGVSREEAAKRMRDQLVAPDAKMASQPQGNETLRQ